MASWIAASPRFGLAGVLGRDAGALPPAALAIDAAGPRALRALGPRLLAAGDLWTVGAAALADEAFRAEMADIAHQTGHRLRLFTPWIAGPSLLPPGVQGRLHVVQSAPGLGAREGLLFSGPLADAALAFPDHLSSAVAAALAGPGIAASTAELVSAAPGTGHRITATLDWPGGQVVTNIAFGTVDPHPVAGALIAALARLDDWIN